MIAEDTFPFKNDTYQTQGFCGYDSDLGMIIVSFRGSSNPTNYFQDAYAYPRATYAKCKDCEVHPGFYNSFLSVKSQLFNGLKVLHKKYPKAGCFVAAHSLGAAMQSFAALDILTEL